MMTTMGVFGQGRLVLLAVALAAALFVAGCATTGPLSSHGVDYAPSFNPEEGVGG
jgi:hypothetical protein